MAMRLKHHRKPANAGRQENTDEAMPYGWRSDGRPTGIYSEKGIPAWIAGHTPVPHGVRQDSGPGRFSRIPERDHECIGRGTVSVEVGPGRINHDTISSADDVRAARIRQ